MKRNAMQQELLSLAGGANTLAVQLLGNPDDAADAVQDSLLAVLSKPRSYKARKGPLRPWFLRVVRNRCIDLIRQRRPVDDVLETLADPGDTPEEALAQGQRDEALQVALRALEHDQREIVVLREFLDLSYAEIGAVLELPPGTVMSRLHRARLALIARLSAAGDVDDEGGSI